MHELKLTPIGTYNFVSKNTTNGVCAGKLGAGGGGGGGLPFPVYTNVSTSLLTVHAYYSDANTFLCRIWQFQLG